MMTKSNIELEAILHEYLNNNSILIVDTVTTARVNLAGILTKFGAVRQKMSLVGSVEEAKAEIKKLKPKIIFSDFNIGSESGLELIQNQKAEYLKENIKDTIFILVTTNASQSVVARASEEDVDTFVIKPYTIETLKKALLQSVQVKLMPNRYLQLIEEGKDRLGGTLYDEAVLLFEQATHENPEPSLACYYYGQTEFLRISLEESEHKFQQGLSYNSIHFKCLVGLYDLLASQKKYTEAYDVIRTIAQYFPANPQRMATVLRLAIITENFQDMEGYYSIFLKIGERSDDLIKSMCSALVVTGKYYLRTQFPTRALEVFEKAAISAAGRTVFLFYIIETLIDFKMLADADRFLNRLHAVAPGSHEYLAGKFLISSQELDLEQAIKLGRDTVRASVEIASVHEKLIQLCVRGGYREAADELYRFACSRWPEKQGNFIYALESQKLEKAVDLKA
ncbi:MAG: response regulator [Bdellovibrionales bacterium]|nr:response regulator [Oligoflexia bacterium]